MELSRKLVLFSCRSGRPLAEKIAAILNTNLASTEIKMFSNNEFTTIIGDSVRGADTYVVQLIDDPLSDRSPADNFWELAETVDAIRRSNGFNGYVTVIMPNFFRARQHKRKDREPLSIRLVADTLGVAGANLVMTLDVHSDATHGCFSGVKFENLYFSRHLISALYDLYPETMKNTDNLAFASVDLGGLQRAKFYAQKCGCELIAAEKFKDYSVAGNRKIEETVILGKAEGKNIIIVDDMIDTAGTVFSGVRELKETHKAGDVLLVCTHPILSGSGPERLAKMYEQGWIKGLICSDTVTHDTSKFGFPMHVVTCAGLYAEAIKICHQNLSIKVLLE